MQMRTNRGWLTGILSGIVVLSVTGSSHAQNFTISSTWFTSQIGGSTAGFLADIAGTNSPLAANAGLTWDEITGAGTSQNFIFTNPMNATIYDGVGVAEGWSKATDVQFSGAGSATISFTQSFTFRDIGTSGRFIYNGSTSPSGFSIPRAGGGGYGFTANFVSQPLQDVAFSSPGGSASYSWPTATMSITYQGLVPEPATLALFGLGLAPIAVAIRRRRK